jgi:hypothetical protein
VIKDAYILHKGLQPLSRRNADFLFCKIDTFDLSLSLFCLPQKGHGCRETLRFGFQTMAARKKLAATTHGGCAPFVGQGSNSFSLNPPLFEPNRGFSKADFSRLQPLTRRERCLYYC